MRLFNKAAGINSDGERENKANQQIPAFSMPLFGIRKYRIIFTFIPQLLLTGNPMSLIFSAGKCEKYHKRD